MNIYIHMTEYIYMQVTKCGPYPIRMESDHLINSNKVGRDDTHMNMTISIYTRIYFGERKRSGVQRRAHAHEIETNSSQSSSKDEHPNRRGSYEL